MENERQNMENSFIYDVIIQLKESNSGFLKQVISYSCDKQSLIASKKFEERLDKVQKEDFSFSNDNELFDLKKEKEKDKEKNLIEHLCTTDIKAFYAITRYLKPTEIICLGRYAEAIVKSFKEKINEIEGSQSKIYETKIIYEEHPAADGYRNKRS